MNKKAQVLIVLGVILAALVITGLMIFGWISGTYNDFVTQSNTVDTQLSQVETMYQRRFDLIPNLVAAARGYIIHEEKVFSDIAQARTHYTGAVGDDKIKAQGTLDGALARLLVIMENYPNLKADQTVRDLMAELAGTENRINIARQRYNEEVRLFNTKIQVFPGNLIASTFNFKDKPLYVSETGANKAPVVNLEVK
jgi:LemA protein